ncbi:hypothetical protein M0802_016111, partial [Mischocyttarus mexicanus]
MFIIIEYVMTLMTRFKIQKMMIITLHAILI